MRIIIAACCCLAIQVVFAQARKQLPVNYKTLQSTEFVPGDRIPLPSLATEKVAGKYQKYRVLGADSLNVYRAFMFAHPEMEYRIVVTWEQLGRKFPSLTDAVTDTLIQFFRRPAISPDNRLYIHEVYHTFAKDVEGVKFEMEILSVGKSPVLNAYTGTSLFLLPQDGVIYRKYKNELVIDTTKIPAGHRVWVEDKQLLIQYKGRGKAVVQLSRKRTETVATLYSGQTITTKNRHGKYIFEVKELPAPGLYLNGVPLKNVSLADLQQPSALFSAAYENGQFPLAAFRVSQVIMLVAGKKMKFTGAKISSKVTKAITAAPAGSEISITTVILNGNRRVKYYDVLKLVK